MNLEERINYYSNGYKILKAYALGKGGRIHLGVKGDSCRFCGLSEPNATFRNDSHAVPEFLGNHQLILNNECDECNSFFSRTLEDHLDKYTRPYRTIAQIRGKTKVPSYKSRDTRARYDVKPSKHPTIVARLDEPHVSINREDKTLTYHFQIEPHIPVAVYKCLVKIGLSIVEKNELTNFSKALQWIRTPNCGLGFFAPLALIKTFIPGPRPTDKLELTIFRKKDMISIRPSYFLLVAFGNIAFQIILPSDLDFLMAGTKYVLKPIPLPFELHWPYGSPKVDLVMLDGVNVVKDMILPITFSYDDIEIAEDYTGKSLQELGYKI